MLVGVNPSMTPKKCCRPTVLIFNYFVHASIAVYFMIKYKFVDISRTINC